MKVCHSDDEDFPEYPFWVVLEEARSRVPAVETIPLEITHFAETVARAGIQLFQPTEGWGTVGWTPSGTVYGGA